MENGIVRPDHPQLPHFRSIQRLRAAGDYAVEWEAMTASGGHAGAIALHYDDRKKKREAKEAASKRGRGRGKKRRGGGGGGGGGKGSWRGRGKRAAR
jgi:hypothetical protein